jgi:hypothetical protein
MFDMVLIDAREMGRGREKDGAGLPDFSWHNIPKRGKYTQLR